MCGVTFLALAHVRRTNTTMQAVSLALLLKIVNEGGIEWKKKLSSWKNITNFFIQSLLRGIFFFFGKIDFSFDDFWSNFLFLLGPICRFRTNYVILQENF